MVGLTGVLWYEYGAPMLGMRGVLWYRQGGVVVWVGSTHGRPNRGCCDIGGELPW